jgi:hypothetical protein
VKERFCGCHTIFGVEDEHSTPYMTRIWLGRLRLHIFHRGDADPDCHDHPWDFWTFPLTSYVEEVVTYGLEQRPYDPYTPRSLIGTTRHQIVRSGRVHYRPAEHTHRVLGRFDAAEGWRLARLAFTTGERVARPSPPVRPGKIITIVWRGKQSRKWGFLRNRDGNWCWTPWKTYVFGNGKHAPCEPGDGGAA